MPIEGELALQILRDVIQGESVGEMREVGIECRCAGYLEA
jgi:hypothetical protein